MIYALDSNIISYILKKDPQIINRYREESDNENNFNIPPVVYYEVNRGLFSLNATKKIDEFIKLCLKFGIGEMTLPMWKKSAEIYANLKKHGKLIEDDDILIAAYCIVNDYTLVTNNTAHFERVKDLKYVNWK